MIKSYDSKATTPSIRGIGSPQSLNYHSLNGKLLTLSHRAARMDWSPPSARRSENFQYIWNKHPSYNMSILSLKLLTRQKKEAAQAKSLRSLETKHRQTTTSARHRPVEILSYVYRPTMNVQVPTLAGHEKVQAFLALGTRCDPP